MGQVLDRLYTGLTGDSSIPGADNRVTTFVETSIVLYCSHVPSICLLQSNSQVAWIGCSQSKYSQSPKALASRDMRLPVEWVTW